MLYNNTFFYLLNLININKAQKSLYFNIILTKKTLNYVRIVYQLNYISKYEIISIDEKKFIRLYLNYFNLLNVGKDFKIFSKPSHRFFISLKSLKLLNKRAGLSIYLISTSFGIISHKEAIFKKIGGMLLGSFLI